MSKLLEVEDLRVSFRTDDGVVQAVDGVSFHLEPGEILGIVGESGSGKSVSMLALMGLVPCPPGKVSGSARLGGTDVLALRGGARRRVRGRRLGMIFQDPMTSLNPYLTIGAQMVEAMQLHEGAADDVAARRAIELLEQVGLPEAAARMSVYPHQLSGGQRQRVMIAMALMLTPEVLIADEPTTALDVTIQAQILELLNRVRREGDNPPAIIMITHDLGVVAGLTDRVQVMYAGRLVETGTTRQVFKQPAHPYTRGLLASIPRLDVAAERLEPIRGNPPDLVRLPPGCAFAPRCPEAETFGQRCIEERPALVGLGQPGRCSACHLNEGSR